MYKQLGILFTAMMGFGLSSSLASTADFTSNTVCYGAQTHFEDASTIDSGAVILYQWDFDNDGTFDASGEKVSHMFSAAGTYDVRYQITTDKGEVSSTINTVIVNPTPSVSFSIQNQCHGDSTMLTASGSIQTGVVTAYSWDLNNDGVFGEAMGMETKEVFGAAGNHPVGLRAMSDKGCTTDTLQVVSIHSVPSASFNVTSQCAGDAMYFENTSVAYGNATYHWEFGDDSTSMEENTVHTYAEGGTYTVNLTASFPSGCSDAVSKHVEVYHNPEATFSVTNACLHDANQFTNTSSNSHVEIENIKWSLGDGTTSFDDHPSHVFGADGLYEAHLMVKTKKGCEASTSRKLNVWPLPNPQIVPSGSTVFCEGESVGLSVDIPSADFLLWSTGDTKSSIEAKNNTDYRIVVIDTNNCTGRDSIEVVANQLPDLIVSNDTTISLGSSAQLSVEGAASYIWVGDDLSNPLVSEPTVSPSSTTTYAVTGTSKEGCVSTNSVTVFVNTDYAFEVSNVITPNGDGFNDTWWVENIEAYSECKVMIYNQWGQEVFSQTGYNNDWQGTNDGEELPTGTYYYMIDCGGDAEVLEGDINIVRLTNN